MCGENYFRRDKAEMALSLCGDLEEAADKLRVGFNFREEQAWGAIACCAIRAMAKIVTAEGGEK